MVKHINFLKERLININSGDCDIFYICVFCISLQLDQSIIKIQCSSFVSLFSCNLLYFEAKPKEQNWPYFDLLKW